jgi:hypothetical protein
MLGIYIKNKKALLILFAISIAIISIGVLILANK